MAACSEAINSLMFLSIPSSSGLSSGPQGLPCR